MENNSIIALGAILIGLVLCFSGFKLQKLVITLVWFVIGFGIARYVCPYFTDSSSIKLIVEIIAGILLGSIGFKLEKLALMIAVAYLVYKSFGSYINGFDPNINLIIRIVVSLVIGGLATLFIKPILIVVSALGGTALIKEYLTVLLNVSPSVMGVILVVLLIAGIVMQFKTS